MRVSRGVAWIKGYARGMTLLVLLAAVAAVATGFSGSPQGTGQSFTPPTNVAATSSGDTITVSWTPGSGASVPGDSGRERAGRHRLLPGV